MQVQNLVAKIQQEDALREQSTGSQKLVALAHEDALRVSSLRDPKSQWPLLPLPS